MEIQLILMDVQTLVNLKLDGLAQGPLPKLVKEYVVMEWLKQVKFVMMEINMIILAVNLIVLVLFLVFLVQLEISTILQFAILYVEME